MLDLTKIEKPFFLLDRETQDALRAHDADGNAIELMTDNGWSDAPFPRFYGCSTYRAKPQPRVIKARYGVGKVDDSVYLPRLTPVYFNTDLWPVMTGEIVVGDDGWPVSITLKREAK